MCFYKCEQISLTSTWNGLSQLSLILIFKVNHVDLVLCVCVWCFFRSLLHICCHLKGQQLPIVFSLLFAIFSFPSYFFFFSRSSSCFRLVFYYSEIKSACDGNEKELRTGIIRIYIIMYGSGHIIPMWH